MGTFSLQDNGLLCGACLVWKSAARNPCREAPAYTEWTYLCCGGSPNWFFFYVWPELDDDMTLPELSVEVPFHQGEKVWILRSPIHDTAPSSDPLLTLERRMLEGETRWSTIVKVPGEFTFIDC